VIDVTSIKALVDIAPQLAGIIAMLIVLRRWMPDKGERELEREVRLEQSRILREVDRKQAEHVETLRDHGRRLDTHDEAIQQLGKQTQTSIASGRN
jgi:hypothetical protein